MTLGPEQTKAGRGEIRSGTMRLQIVQANHCSTTMANRTTRPSLSTFHPATPSSSPEHIIYAFIINSQNVLYLSLNSEKKWKNKKVRDWPILKKFANLKFILFDPTPNFRLIPFKRSLKVFLSEIIVGWGNFYLPLEQVHEILTWLGFFKPPVRPFHVTVASVPT